MKIYYDVTIKDVTNNSSVSYIADTFSIEDGRVVRIKSREYGNVTFKMQPNERLVVEDMIIEEEFDKIEENHKVGD